MKPAVNIVIPTFNRAGQIGEAIEAALSQDYSNCLVTVIDDGSTDDTLLTLHRFRSHPQFRYVALEHNVGTAQAKNVAIALNDCEFMTFHDSDDLPTPNKISRQVATAVQPEVCADPVLNWSLVNTEPGSHLSIDLVVSEHTLVQADGTQHHIRRALSLVDDVFPNLQMAAGVPGDWILINCGLFRATIFRDLGGFRNCIEEDRDLRNRLLFNGRVIWLMPEILLTKYECEDSLTSASETDYASVRRVRDRQQIWKDAGAFSRGRRSVPEPIDLSNVVIRHCSTPMGRSSALLTDETRSRLTKMNVPAMQPHLDESASRCTA